MFSSFSFLWDTAALEENCGWSGLIIQMLRLPYPPDLTTGRAESLPLCTAVLKLAHLTSWGFLFGSFWSDCRSRAPSSKLLCLPCIVFTQSCPTLCDLLDCSLLGSSVRGVFQARILKWVAISFSSLSCTLSTFPRSHLNKAGGLICAFPTDSNYNTCP